jgi:hypothetical protein
MQRRKLRQPTETVSQDTRKQAEGGLTMTKTVSVLKVPDKAQEESINLVRLKRGVELLESLQKRKTGKEAR